MSIVMTVCTTLGAVPLTPLLTKILAGTYVPVDAAKLVLSENVVRLKASMVGMQNSSLGVVLATSHFTSPMVALPSTLFVVIMNIMGSSLAFF
ncbi:unnamed protein product [Prunus armeniaca]